MKLMVNPFESLFWNCFYSQPQPVIPSQRNFWLFFNDLHLFQIRNVEISNEKVINAVNESGKSQVEVLEAVLAELRLNRDEMKHGREENSRIGREMLEQQSTILNEVRTFKEDSNRQQRETTRAFKDATAEISTLCDDLTRQFKALVAAVKASR